MSDFEYNFDNEEVEARQIKMPRQEFFMRLSRGNIDAWNVEIEPDEFSADGIIHCFGNSDVHICLTIGYDGEEYYSYWDSEGNYIELLDISYN